MSDPGRTWQYRLKGQFIQDGKAVTAYSATGNMLVNGKAIRSCNVQLAPL